MRFVAAARQTLSTRWILTRFVAAACQALSPRWILMRFVAAAAGDGRVAEKAKTVETSFSLFSRTHYWTQKMGPFQWTHLLGPNEGWGGSRLPAPGSRLTSMAPRSQAPSNYGIPPQCLST